MPMKRYVLRLDEVSMDDVPLVGGKTASIGELMRSIGPLGVRVPPGFAVTAQAFRDMIEAAGAAPRLHALLDGLDKGDSAALAHAGAQARAIVNSCPMPAAVEAALRSAWRTLAQQCAQPDLRVAVRSSATAEDLPHASFAGQHESFLNVAGEDAVVDAVRRCQASLFTDRAIAYRIDQGFDHFQVALSVAVMKMVRSDLAASGVAFTLDTESGHPDVVRIDAAWGLGEAVVQGSVDPDEFVVHKPTYRLGARCVISHRIGDKQTRVVLGPVSTPGSGAGTGVGIFTEPVPEQDRTRPCLSDANVLALAGMAMRIEDHYSQRAGHLCPMDIEWAQDGPDGPLYIVQARPETVASQQPSWEIERHELDAPGPPESATLLRGRAIGERIAQGGVRRIQHPRDLPTFRPGEVLVAPTTTPDWEPVMKTAAAIVTEHGGRTCHAAIVARELGIPALVGAPGACTRLADGQAVTVSCAEGDTGRVLDGHWPFHTERTALAELPRTRTHLLVNLGNPGLAFRTARLPCDGVGLARMEFIISEHIGAHPMALLYPQRVTDAAERERVLALCNGHASGSSYFVERLAEGIATIAAAFWPRPVTVRLSDFKSSEYAALAGGRDFEPHEENPMLGLRGAARYVHPSYREAFALECAAILRVREQMGLRNLQVMVPFVRRLEEAQQVLAAMAGHGLARTADMAPAAGSPPDPGAAGASFSAGPPEGLQIVMMCEIPNNVILMDEFAALFDGFSIGSNDLTQLTLGVDRDSALVAPAFDERDPGMLKMYQLAIDGAHRHGRTVGICGQAPSDHPDLAARLVAMGIDSLSLSADRLPATWQQLAALEGQAQAQQAEASLPSVLQAAH
jgi:pyruvate, water dikinase